MASLARAEYRVYASISPGGKAVFQIIDSVTTTCMKFANDYGTWVAGAVLGFVAVGIALKVFVRIFRRGGPNQGA